TVLLTQEALGIAHRLLRLAQFVAAVDALLLEPLAHRLELMPQCLLPLAQALHAAGHAILIAALTILLRITLVTWAGLAVLLLPPIGAITLVTLVALALAERLVAHLLLALYHLAHLIERALHLLQGRVIGRLALFRRLQVLQNVVQFGEQLFGRILRAVFRHLLQAVEHGVKVFRRHGAVGRGTGGGVGSIIFLARQTFPVLAQ